MDRKSGPSAPQPWDFVLYPPVDCVPYYEREHEVAIWIRRHTDITEGYESS